MLPLIPTEQIAEFFLAAVARHPLSELADVS
jgi:hypothetical protein